MMRSPPSQYSAPVARGHTMTGAHHASAGAAAAAESAAAAAESGAAADAWAAPRADAPHLMSSGSFRMGSVSALPLLSLAALTALHARGGGGGFGGGGFGGGGFGGGGYGGGGDAAPPASRGVHSSSSPAAAAAAAGVDHGLFSRSGSLGSLLDIALRAEGASAAGILSRGMNSRGNSSSALLGPVPRHDAAAAGGAASAAAAPSAAAAAAAGRTQTPMLQFY